MTDPTPLQKAVELLPCPFCGARAVIKQAGETRYWWVGCEIHLCEEPKGCGVSRSAYDKQEAIDRWNTRPAAKQLEALQKENEELKKGAANMAARCLNVRDALNEYHYSKSQLAVERLERVAEGCNRSDLLIRFEEYHTVVNKERDSLKSTIQLMEHGKYGRVDLTNQILSLKSQVEELKVRNFALDGAMQDWQDISDSLKLAIRNMVLGARECGHEGEITKKNSECPLCVSLSHPLVKQALEGK